MRKFGTIVLLLICGSCDDESADKTHCPSLIERINTSNFVYNIYHQLVAIKDAENNFVEVDFFYDSNGQLTESCKRWPDPSICSFYDSDEMLSNTMVHAFGEKRTTKYYWHEGLLTGLEIRLGGSAPEVLTDGYFYTYDAEGNLMESTGYSYTDGIKSDSSIFKFEYSSEENILNVLFEHKNELLPYYGHLVLCKYLPTKITHIRYSDNLVTECEYENTIDFSILRMKGECGETKIDFRCE